MMRKPKWTRHAILRFRQRFKKMNRFEVFAESERVTAKAYKRYTGRDIPSYFTRINYKFGAIFIVEVSPITKRRMIVTVFSTIRRRSPAGFLQQSEGEKMAKKINLSERAKLLLYFVDEATEKDWGHGVGKSFFVPKSSLYFYYHNNKSQSTYISGPGDANAFKSLERKGLIRRPKTSLANEYIYETTEDGHALVATFIDEFTFKSNVIVNVSDS